MSKPSKPSSILPARKMLAFSAENPAKEYRIEDGNVEVRTLDPEGGSHQGGSHRRTGNVWWRLTPEQLSIHVERNTVVAQWMERRLGWRRLLQACVGQEPSMWNLPRTQIIQLSDSSIRVGQSGRND